jgi:hypothetical protein
LINAIRNAILFFKYHSQDGYPGILDAVKKLSCALSFGLFIFIMISVLFCVRGPCPSVRPEAKTSEGRVEGFHTRRSGVESRTVPSSSLEAEPMKELSNSPGVDLRTPPPRSWKARGARGGTGSGTPVAVPLGRREIVAARNSLLASRMEIGEDEGLVSGGALEMGDESKYILRLKSGRYLLRRNAPVTISGSSGHLLIQFKDVPSRTEKKALEGVGVTLGGHLGSYSWYGRVPAGSVERVRSLPFVRAVGEVCLTDKIPPRMLLEGVGAWAVTGEGDAALRISFFKDVRPDEALDTIVRLGGTVVSVRERAHKVEARFPIGRIPALLREDSVRYVTEAPPPKTGENDGARENVGADLVHVYPYNLDGSGVQVGIWDEGDVDSSHDDFGERVTVVDNAGVGIHATHVAGTVCGSGLLSATKGGTPYQWKGMAPQAGIISYDWYSNISEHNGAINVYGIEISQNSWGYVVDEYRYGNCWAYGDYIWDAPEYDQIVTGLYGKRITVVFSAGNERDEWDCGVAERGGYACVAPPHTAKNIICVGALNSEDSSMTEFSSWGPTDDGRIKPDVMAPGDEEDGLLGIKSTIPGDRYGSMRGTSMSAPVVSGCVALLIEDYRANYAGSDPLPSTLKGLLIHTAQDLGNTGPDYSYGYGKIDVKAAVDQLRSGYFAEDEIAHGETKTYILSVPTGATEAKATLVWDDAAGAEEADPALFNNLDVVMEDPEGGVHYPWILDPGNPSNPAQKGIDNMNNVEQVQVSSSLVEGDWKVQVTGFYVPGAHQDYTVLSNYPLRAVTPTPTPKSTPSPTPTQDPTEEPEPDVKPTLPPIFSPVTLELHPGSISPGAILTVSAAVLPVLQPFDAYLAVRFPNGSFYFFSAGGQSGFTPRAYMAGIQGLSSIWSGTLLEITIPEGVDPGIYVFYCALFPSGASPRLGGGSIGGVATATVEMKAP